MRFVWISVYVVVVLLPVCWFSKPLSIDASQKTLVGIVQFYVMSGAISNSSATVVSAATFDDCANACISYAVRIFLSRKEGAFSKIVMVFSTLALTAS